MHLAFYVFGAGHKERHYLKNPRGTRYELAVTRDPAQAKAFKTAADAETAMRSWLEKTGGSAHGMIPGSERALEA